MKKLKNKYFTINFSDSLVDIVKDMLEISLYKTKEIYDFFKIDRFRCVTVNLFDDLGEFKSFVANIRGVSIDDLPKYVQGTFDKGMINSYINPNIKKDSIFYKRKVHMIFHEFAHIIYLEYILKNDVSKRVIWLDEGLAQNLSGEFSDDDFDNFLNKFKSFKNIPNLNELKHGKKFVNDDYNGYVISYLVVKYLIQTRTYDELLTILENNELSKEIGNEIVNEMKEYYLGKSKVK